MNKILVNSIVDPTIGQPFTGPSLDFLQTANKLALVGVAAGFAQTAFSATTPICLWGGQKYFNGGTSYTFNPAWFFIGGEVIPFLGVTTNIATTPILTIVEAATPGPDPLVFSDNISRNVHMTRTISIADGALNSGDANYVDLFFINDTWHEVTGGVGFQNSWADYTAAARVAYTRVGERFVSLKGLATQAGALDSVVFTLPVGYRPIQTQQFVISKINISVPTIYTVVIATTGTVTVQSNGATNSAISLDGIILPIK